jgi:hypothetical protein
MEKTPDTFHNIPTNETSSVPRVGLFLQKDSAPNLQRKQKESSTLVHSKCKKTSTQEKKPREITQNPEVGTQKPKV